MFNAVFLPVQNKKPGFIPFVRGILCNQLWRQFEMEIFGSHRAKT